MAFEVNCPNCFKSYRFAMETAGKKFQCKACDQLFTIGSPELNILAPPPIQVAAKSKTTTAKSSVKSTSSPITPLKRPGLFQILFDFGLKNYYTPWVVRASWAAAVLLYCLSLFVALMMFLTTIVPIFKRIGQEDFSLLQALIDDGQTLVGLVLVELILLIALLAYRTILELIIVAFDISETLKADSERR